MYALLIIFCFPLTLAISDNELNKPQKDRYILHRTCEAAVEKQINEEMHASLVYATMAAHFDHNSIARKGFAKYFSENSLEEREHAHKFIDYLNRRGARFTGFDIKMPSKYSWNKAIDALSDAINLEKHVNNKLHNLHEIAATECVDQHLMDFLEAEYFDEQVRSIDNLQRHISILNGMDTSMGEFLFDQQLQGLKTEL